MNPLTPPIEEEQEVAKELDSSCNHHQQSINASSHEESSSSSSSSFRGNKHALRVVGIGAGSSSRPPNEFTRDATGRSDRSRFANWLTNTIPLPHCCCPFFGVQPFGPRTRLYQVWQGKNQVIVNLILASTRDPGIIPRNQVSNATDIISRSRRVSVEGVSVKIKYCKICKIYRPPRSCHCVVCDNCVDRFDHHCPWIGQCIGLRNSRYYLMFILSALVFFSYIFAFSWLRIRRNWSKTRSGLFRMLGDAPETFLLALFSFMAIWLLGGFFIFHAYLIAHNQTARENFKQSYAKTPNPYDKGILRNIKEALFTRLPPSKVNFRALVEPDWCSIARMLASSPSRGDEPTVAVQHVP
ncbi:probable protein S-acyltransferase 7 [Musa acuminata AAA Group]|uniref:probable protein S-acyltransferase 7 n=1 Tax=Musa acuminata AAA Group TaxID=214697 RepID=UPI0031D6C2E0